MCCRNHSDATERDRSLGRSASIAKKSLEIPATYGSRGCCDRGTGRAPSFRQQPLMSFPAIRHPAAGVAALRLMRTVQEPNFFKGRARRTLARFRAPMLDSAFDDVTDCASASQFFVVFALERRRVGKTPVQARGGERKDGATRRRGFVAHRNDVSKVWAGTDHVGDGLGSIA